MQLGTHARVCNVYGVTGWTCRVPAQCILPPFQKLQLHASGSVQLRVYALSRVRQASLCSLALFVLVKAARRAVNDPGQPYD